MTRRKQADNAAAVIVVEPAVAVKIAGCTSLEAAIESVIKRSNGLSSDVHTVALACLTHAKDFGDPRKLDRLVSGLHKAMRPQALMVWAERYSPVRWNGDGKVGILKADSKKYTPFNIEAASEDPYWTPAESIKQPLTLAKLKGMIAQMSKKVDKVDAGELELAEGENIVAIKDFVHRMEQAAQAA